MPSRHSESDDEITPITRKGTHPDYKSTQDESSAPLRSTDHHSALRRREQAKNPEDGGSNTRRRSTPPSIGNEEGEEKLTWYKRIAEKYGSVELENKGSVARDHLALERTFLAWLRTSLAFASIGIAITQLFRLNTTIARRADMDGASQVGALDSISASDAAAATRLRHVGKPLGATFLGIAILVLSVGFHRYFESQHWIIRGKFPASRGSVALVAAVSAALIVASLVVVIAVAPTSFQT